MPLWQTWTVDLTTEHLILVLQYAVFLPQRKRETVDAATEAVDQSQLDDDVDIMEPSQSQDTKGQIKIDKLLSLDQAILQSVEQCGQCPPGVITAVRPRLGPRTMNITRRDSVWRPRSAVLNQ